MDDKIGMQGIVYIAAMALVTAMTIGGAYLMYYAPYGIFS